MVRLQKVEVNKKEPLVNLLGEWFWGRGEDVNSKGLIAREIVKIRRDALGKGEPINRDQLNAWVMGARKYLELHRGCTLVNVRNVGWKVSTPKETAEYSMTRVRQTIRLAERTLRLADIVDVRFIPGAFVKVFKKADGGLRGLVNKGKQFILTWDRLKNGRGTHEGKKTDRIGVSKDS